ncbi:MAG: ATP-binding protein [Pseudomonadota bacterium]
MASQMRLRSKITIAVSILVISLMFTVAYFSLFYLEKQLKATISQNQSVLVAGLAGEINQKLASAHSQLTVAAQSIPKAALKDANFAQSFLENMIVLRQTFDNQISILTPDGKILAEEPFLPDRRGFDASYRSYYKNTVATMSPVISDPYISSLIKKNPIIMMTSPILDEKGTLAGILLGAINLMGDNILKDISQIKIGHKGYLYLTTRESRTMIMHPDVNRILEFISPGVNHLYDQAVGGFEGTGETVNSYGVSMLTSFKHLKTANWILAANYPISEAHDLCIDLEKKFFLFGSIGIIFILCIVYYLIKYFLYPLVMLTKHIEDLPGKVGKAKLITVNTGDEIGALSQAFNNMIDKLDLQKEALQKSEERYRNIYNSVSDAIFIQDITTGAILDVNQKMCEMYGFSPEETTLIDVGSLSAGESPYSMKEAMVFISRAAQGEPQFFEWRAKDKLGRLFWVEVKMRLVEIDGLTRLLVTASDITERKQVELDKILLEEKLLQAQKMEAIGTLAGGIAHDFNNILTALIGYSSLLHAKIAEDNPLRMYVEQILKSADMAANLTRNLLAFTRKQVTETKLVNVNTIIHGIEKLLQRLLSEDIELRTIPTAEDAIIMMDITQLEQILLNFAANARDAMPHGGKMMIETLLMQFDDSFVRAHGFGKPGDYVLISVTDTGIGMEEKIKERIFDPFFTTKEVGKGTGLGLSTVYGIVKQFKGFITVYSEPGEGTTFHVYLPLATEKMTAKKASLPFEIAGGTETILIAEDHMDSRCLIKEVLGINGYDVIETVDGSDAVEKYLSCKKKISLLLLDVVMPKKNGVAAYTEIKKINPSIKVIFMSGYTGDVVLNKGIQEERFNFISKPLSPNTLLMKVREVLDVKI